MQRRIITCISVLAGGGDLLTGLALVIVPERALALMHVPMVPDLVFIRFIGSFVGTVGLSYFTGLVAWWWTGSLIRLRVVWELTILFRLVAGGFVLSQVAMGNLSWPWLSVPVADWAWAFLQAWLLCAGYFKEATE